MKSRNPLNKSFHLSLRLVWIRFLIICLIICSLGPIPIARASQSDEGAYIPLSVPQLPGGNVVDLALAPSDPHVLYALVIGTGGYDLYRSLDGGLTWQKRHIFSFMVDQLNRLAVDPGNSSVVYAYGYYDWDYERSTDGGATWENGPYLGELFAAPSSDRLYVVSGGSYCSNYTGNNYTLERSDNGGTTWVSSDLGCLVPQAMTMAVLDSQPDLVYLAFLKSGDSIQYLRKSVDGGQTWQEFPLSPYPFSTFLIDPQNPSRLYASGYSGIYTSTDGGAGWHEISLPAMGTNHQLALAGSRLYAVQATGDRTPLYYTDDAGITWWASATLLPAGAGRLQADPAHPQNVWAGLVNYGVYFSGDGGASWSEQNTGISSTSTINSLAASPAAPDVVYAAISDPYAAVFRSDDGGQTWGARMPGFEDAGLNPMQTIHAVSPVTLHGSGVSNAPALVIHKLLAHLENPAIAWAATNTGVYETLDGQHWAPVSLPLDIIDLTVSPALPDYVIGVSRESQGYIYLPTRGCDPTTHQCRWYYDQKRPGQITFNVLRLAPLVPRLLTDGDVYQSGNKVVGIYQEGPGSTWQLLGDLGVDGKVSGLEIAPQNPRFMLATVENFPGNMNWLFCSQDGGATWVDWSAGLPQLFGRSYLLVIDDLGTAYAGTYDGVYRRRPNDAAWEPYWLDQLLMRSIGSLAYVPGSAPKLLASTEYVLWKLDLPPIQRVWLPLVRESTP